MRFDLTDGFPLVTTKKLHLRVDRPRAAVVPEGRDQHRLPEGQQGRHLGRVGRRGRRPRPGLRQAVAQLGRRRRRRDRPDPLGGRRDQAQSRFAPPDRQRLERRRPAEDGADALPHACSSSTWPTASSAASCTSARRHFPRRAVQHRQLRAADAHGRAGLRPGRRRFRAHASAMRTCTRNHFEQAREQLSRTPRALPTLRAQSGRDRPVRVPLRRHRASKATTRSRRSRRRWRCEPAIVPGRRARSQPRHRSRQRPAVAPARRPEALQGADARQAGADGAQDRRVAGACLAGPSQPGADALRPACRSTAWRPWRRSMRRWRKRARAS